MIAKNFSGCSFLAVQSGEKEKHDSPIRGGAKPEAAAARTTPTNKQARQVPDETMNRCLQLVLQRLEKAPPTQHEVEFPQ